MKELTQAQQETLAAIRQFLADNNIPPSLRDLMAVLDISSTSVIGARLNRLEAKGFIERTYGLARSIRLTEKAQKEGV